MKIRNRMSDVVELRNHVCQGFMKMITADNWRETLYCFVQDEINKPHKNNYIEQYKKIRKKGIENYSIDDMDVPFIVNIIQFCPQIATATKESKLSLRHIKEDRHITNHSSENEPDEELYLRALISLRDLQNFLHTVDDYETAISDEKRSQFVRVYSKEIDDLKLKIYNDCIELFQIKKDIQQILSSENQEDIFYQVYEVYIKRWSLSAEDKYKWRLFVIEASNAGINCAHGYAANAFLFLKDIDSATHCYEMMIEGPDSISVSVAHQITDFVNDLYIKGEKPTERMLQLVKRVKEQGYDIEETTTGIIWNK